MRTFFSAVVLALALAGSSAFAPRSNFLARAAASGVAPLRAAPVVTAAEVKLPASVKPGVVTGQAFRDLLNYAKVRGFAMPGVNIVGEYFLRGASFSVTTRPSFSRVSTNRS
jgi:fructose-bisphosphate aldolase class II